MGRGAEAAARGLTDIVAVSSDGIRAALKGAAFFVELRSRRRIAHFCD